MYLNKFYNFENKTECGLEIWQALLNYVKNELEERELISFANLSREAQMKELLNLYTKVLEYELQKSKEMLDTPKNF